MDRRKFLELLASGVTGFALDPEQALWIPGKKKIFLPPVSFHRGAFGFVMRDLPMPDPLPPGWQIAIDQSIKNLADAIDRDALKLYERVYSVDILHGHAAIQPLSPTRFEILRNVG